MKNTELIKMLQALPDDTEIALFDWRMSLVREMAGIPNAGIYPEFKIEEVEAPDGCQPWAAIVFSNPDYEDSEDVAAEIMDAAGTTRRCRVCGCTNSDCSGCIAKTGEPCYWVEADLCSACADEQNRIIVPENSGILLPGIDF